MGRLRAKRIVPARKRRKVSAAELEEVRRDIAALWLAFGQHERMLRGALAQLEALGAPPISPLTFEVDPEPPATAPPTQGESREEGQPSISEQLSDLDQVLAAIEQATQTLERTYADEIVAGGEADQSA